MATNQEETQTSSLQDFSFGGEDVEFFGIKAEGSDEQVIKEIKETEKVVTEGAEEEGAKEATNLDAKDKNGNKQVKTPKEEEEEEVVFFEEEKLDVKAEVKTKEKGKEKEEDKDKDKEEDDAEKDDTKFFSTLASELKERGTFQNVEIPEGAEITEEEFFILQDKEIEARVEETFEQFFEELDEDGKRFLEFKKNGGRTQDFLATYQNTLDIPELDVDNKEQVTQVLTHYLINVEGLDADELKDRLDWLKEGGKEKAYATKYYKAIEEEREQSQQQALKAQEAISKKKQESAMAFNEELNKVLLKTEAVGDFPITKVDQKELGTYMTKPTVKIGKNKYVPAFQNEIAKIFKAETEEDKKKLFVIAKLVKTDFDFTDVVKSEKTKIVKVAKSKLQDAKTGVKTASSGQYARRSLTDYFGE